MCSERRTSIIIRLVYTNYIRERGSTQLIGLALAECLSVVRAMKPQSPSSIFIFFTHIRAYTVIVYKKN